MLKTTLFWSSLVSIAGFASSPIISNRENYSQEVFNKMEFSRNIENTLLSIDLKEDVLFKYYMIAVNSKGYVDSFDNFVADFYSSGSSIYEFVDLIRPSGISVLSSGSSGTDYRLGFEDEMITSGSKFARGYPFYNAYEFNDIQVGDIFLEDNATNVWHTGIVVDNYKCASINTTTFRYIQTIEALNNTSLGALDGGVQFGYIDDQRIIQNNVKILRFNSDLSDSQKMHVTQFLYNHVGDSYVLSNSVNVSDDSNGWYCNELVYAAYYHAGIDLFPGEDISNTVLIGTRFLNSSRTREIDIAYDPFLSFGIVSKAGSVWTIRVFNSDRWAHYVYYNEKMCFASDAKSWSGLSDVVRYSTEVEPHSFIVVNISTNFMAGCIAASYTTTFLGRTERFVSCGKNLNAQRKTINRETNLLYD